MKKLSILFALILGFSLSNAQKKGTDWLKLGIHAGVPLAEASDYSSFALGLDAKYQFLDLKSFGLGLATGYTHYFGKENFKDNNLIPLSLLLRYYPTKHFFIGGDIGVGFLFTDADNRTTGFHYRPEVGYHSDEWNLFLYYQGVTSSNLNNLGIGINYNLLRP